MGKLSSSAMPSSRRSRLSGGRRATAPGSCGTPTPPTYIVPADMSVVLLIVIIVIVVAAAVVLLAMRRRGGASEGSSAPPLESKAAQRGLTAGLVVVCAFGLVVPALVLVANAEHKASVGVGGVHLDANQQKGRELFSHSCNLCHTLAGAARGGPHGAQPRRAGADGGLDGAE